MVCKLGKVDCVVCVCGGGESFYDLASTRHRFTDASQVEVPSKKRHTC